MTPERYRSYLATRRFMKSLPALGQVESELLADAAEALLLTRPGREDDAIEALVGIELILNQAVLTHRLDQDRADELRDLAVACGPDTVDVALTPWSPVLTTAQ